MWQEPTPLWLWDVAQVRIVWANQACLDFSGAQSMDDLLRLKFDPEASFIRQLAALSLSEGDPRGQRELIRFPSKKGDFVFDCLCRAREIEPGRAGVLVELVADRGIVQQTGGKPAVNGPKPAVNGKGEVQYKNGALSEPTENEKPKDRGSAQVLCFDGQEDVNGFEVEPEKVDEDDLRTLQEIARMINGPGGLGLGTSPSGVDPENDGRPLVTTRRREEVALAPVEPVAEMKDKTSQSARGSTTSSPEHTIEKSGRRPGQSASTAI